MINEISVKESFDYFMTALCRFDNSNVLLPDDELLHIILEELDIEAVSFLHENTVDRLIENNLIPKNIAALVEELRDKTLTLIQHKRRANDIRNDSDWKALRQLADEIKNKILDHM